MRSELRKALDTALNEIGPIEPWWSEDDEMYVFEHDAYPAVDYAHTDLETVKKRYVIILTDFLTERLKDNVDPAVEKITSGRGGVRAGAGRPVGTVKVPTKQIRIPSDIVDWILENKSDRIGSIRQLMNNPVK